MADAVVFLDTNVFLQCKMLAEIAWRDLFPSASKLLLVIPRSTVREIDRLKAQPRSRRADRARAATTIFRSIGPSPENRLAISTGTIELECCFGSGRIAKGLQDIDYDSNDGKLIAETKGWMEEHRNEEVVILSDDFAVSLSAEAVGIKSLIPPESWLLPPESNEAEKRFRKLEEEVRELKEAGEPTFKITFERDREVVSDKEKILVRQCRPLSTDEVNALVEQFKQRLPIDKGNSDRVYIADLVGMGMQPVSKVARAAYADEAYPEWLSSVKIVLENFHEFWFRKDRVIALDVFVENDGLIPAKDARVVLDAHACEVAVCSSGDSGEDFRDELLAPAQFPLPPKPPVPRLGWHDSLGFAVHDHSALLSAVRNIPSPHDHEDFVLKRGAFDELVDGLAFRCQSFSQHAEREFFGLFVVLPVGKGRAHIGVSVSAANTREATTSNFSIDCEFEEVDPLPLIESELQRLEALYLEHSDQPGSI
jgi:hypothetical protein